MADFDAICRGLAANLATVQLPTGDLYQVSPFLLSDPKPPTLQVAAPEIDYGATFGGDTDELTLIIEAALPRSNDVAAQRLLYALLARTGVTSLKAAAEADTALTSRLADDGVTITTGQDPACACLLVTKFRGATPYTLEKGTHVLLASWAVKVLT